MTKEIEALRAALQAYVRRCPIFAMPARPDTVIVMGGDGRVATGVIDAGPLLRRRRVLYGGAYRA